MPPNTMLTPTTDKLLAGDWTWAMYGVVIDANNAIICRALPGTAATDPYWQIKWMFDDGTNSWVKWAEGTCDARFIATSSTGYTFI